MKPGNFTFAFLTVAAVGGGVYFLSPTNDVQPMSQIFLKGISVPAWEAQCRQNADKKVEIIFPQSAQFSHGAQGRAWLRTLKDQPSWSGNEEINVYKMGLERNLDFGLGMSARDKKILGDKWSLTVNFKERTCDVRPSEEGIMFRVPIVGRMDNKQDAVGRFPYVIGTPNMTPPVYHERPRPIGIKLGGIKAVRPRAEP